jgi:hypothetical protein
MDIAIVSGAGLQADKEKNSVVYIARYSLKGSN